VPETAIRERAQGFPDPHRAHRVALAREREHRIRAGLDVAVDGAGEVDPEERETRVRHGVDEPAHERAALRPEHVVLAANGMICTSGRIPMSAATRSE
jgi:hypothetical protein